MHCTNDRSNGKVLLTSIGEERNRRKLKCGTSYHVCLCVKLSGSFSHTFHQTPHVHTKKNKGSTHLSLAKRAKTGGGAGWCGLYIGKYFAPGRGLNRDKRPTFSPGLSHDPGQKSFPPTPCRPHTL